MPLARVEEFGIALANNLQFHNLGVNIYACNILFNSIIVRIIAITANRITTKFLISS